MSSTDTCYSFSSDLPSSEPSLLSTTARKDNLTDLQYELFEFLFLKRAVHFQLGKARSGYKSNALFNL